MSEEFRGALATNVRDLRTARGWTVRDFALQAGVAAKTVVNVEKGRGCSARVEERLASAFDTVVSRLRQLDPIAESFRVVRLEEGRWFFRDQQQASAFALRQARVGRVDLADRRADPEAIQDASERLRLGANGMATVFLQIKSGRLASGRHMVSLSEIYGRFVQPPDPRRSTFLLHTLQGTIIVEKPTHATRLDPGDTLVFVEDAPVVVRPSEPVVCLADVPRVLVTRLGVEPSSP